MSTKTEATIDDLYRVPENGKAEIVNGELVLMSPTGGVPGRAAEESIAAWMTMNVPSEAGMHFPTMLASSSIFPIVVRSVLTQLFTEASCEVGCFWKVRQSSRSKSAAPTTMAL